jgi:hypothetical protein
MRAVWDPFSFVVVSMAGWMNQHQQQIIEYLVEENRVLREQIGDRRRIAEFDSVMINGADLRPRRRSWGGNYSLNVATIAAAISKLEGLRFILHLLKTIDRDLLNQTTAR